MRYYCRQRRRSRVVRGLDWINGIDYLEVLDADAPAGSPRQETLLVQLLNPLDGGVAFSADNVAIDGGVRIRGIQVEWAARASDAANLESDGVISDAERDLFLERDQPEAGSLLVIRTSTTGDFSTYRLRLIDGDNPLSTLDPPLSEVDFSFKVECPSDFDCRAEDICPPEPKTSPPIDYMARDYASFRRLMLDRLSVVMPEWKERNPADLGVALVEVLAYAADRVSYHQDAVATEAYLGTARRRTSVRRHARLLDYPMHDGVNARSWVAVKADAGVENVLLRRQYLPGERTRFLTRVLGFPALIDEVMFEEMIAEHAPAVFEPMFDLRLFTSHNRISFYTWGDDECCLPAGAMRATLVDDEENRLMLRPGDVVILEEVKGPSTGAAADADPAHRHAVRLTRVTPAAEEDEEGTRFPGTLTSDTLFDQPIVEIEWSEEDALPFPLCISSTMSDEDGQEELVEDISIAIGNVVLADHGRTLPVEDVTAPRHVRKQRSWLRERDVTHAVPFDGDAWMTSDVAVSARTARAQDPRSARPAVSLTDEDADEWHPQRDLLASDRFDAHFIAEVDGDGRASLRFGDDIYGRRPAGGSSLQAVYRTGNGPAGNVGGGAIFHVLTTPGLGIDAGDEDSRAIRNPLGAIGGRAPESLDEVRLYAPQAFRRQERAVTEADYATVTQWHPEVSKAVARRLWTGSWHTMFIAVDRVGGRPVDRAFEAMLTQWLERFKLAGHDIEIEPPQFVPLDIAINVCVKPGYFRSDVKQELLRVFSSVDLPDGRRGYFHPDNFTFGQRVYLSEIIARAMRVSGVRWVDVNPDADPSGAFQRWGQASRGEIDDGFIKIARLEIARLDNDRNAPENGRIVFQMEGGL